ncbi:MAG: phospholipid carrier-dependent glycosyltransferase [Micrococcaceae bacterium]
MTLLKTINTKYYEYASYAFVVFIAAALRFYRLGNPKDLMFDETYYVKDAYSYTQSGYERSWTSDPNPKFIQGDTSGLTNVPEYVVHPPVGKWMIATGIDIFGQPSSFGWRFATALTGTLLVVVLIAVAKKLFKSPLLAATAGLFLAIDGEAISTSRTSILDIYLTFWLLLAFYFMLVDREKVRQEVNAQGLGMKLWRPYRLLTGVSLGLALGVKWTALYFIAAWGILIVLWDITLNIKNLKHSPLAFLYIVPVGLVTYIATWTGWIISSNGYDRSWAKDNPEQTVSWLPDWVQSLWAYHQSAYSFHTHLHSNHPYKAEAITWLLQIRPTAFYYKAYTKGQNGCTVDKCSAAVTNLGNPFLWWFATIALFIVLYYLITRKDWRAGAILSGVAAGWLPWFMYPERTTYNFYAVAFLPYMVLALVYVLGLVLGNKNYGEKRRQVGFILFIAIVVFLVLISAFFYPVWSAEMIPYSSWRARMWFGSWI